MEIRPKITKDYILSKVSQEDIFSYYLNIPIATIKECINHNYKINSPLREGDDNPSFGFRYNNTGKLKARDFAGYFWGDCFDAVAIILSAKYNKVIKVNNPKDFNFILNDIYKITLGELPNPTALDIVKKLPTNIEILNRDWNNADIKYWSKFGINMQILTYYNVIPINNYWINRDVNPDPKYYYNKIDPCYAYYHGRTLDGQNKIKLYFPTRDKNIRPRILSNYSSMEGLNKLRHNDILIITKSYKDVMSIISTYYIMPEGMFSIGRQIDAVSVFSESVYPSENEMQFLKERYKTIFTFMDFDLTGIRMTNKLRKKYDTIPIFLTNGRFKSEDYKAKDFSDYARNNLRSVNILFNKFKDYLCNLN